MGKEKAANRKKARALPKDDLTTGGCTRVSDDSLTSIHCRLTAFSSVLVAFIIVLRVLAFVASQTGDT